MEPNLLLANLQIYLVHVISEIRFIVLPRSVISATIVKLCAVRHSRVFRVLISIRTICGGSFLGRDRRVVEVRALVLRDHGKVWVIIAL